MRAFREGVFLRARISRCPRMNADVSGWLSAGPLCADGLSPLSVTGRKSHSRSSEKPPNPRAPATSHPLSAEMASPTAALRKASARDEPLCHSPTSQWTHIFTFSLTHIAFFFFFYKLLGEKDVNGGRQCIVQNEHDGCAHTIVGPVLFHEKSTN